MNHFEYGFFDELEKIATNKDEVAKMMEYYKREYPGASRRQIGEAATERVQFKNRTKGRLENSTLPISVLSNKNHPRFHSDAARFDVSIPKPGQPGQRIGTNSEQRAKFWERSRRRQSLDHIFRTAPSRAKYGVKPVGLR